MNKYFKMIVGVLFILYVGGTAVNASVSLDASVDASVVEVGQNFTYTVVLSGESLHQIKNFTIPNLSSYFTKLSEKTSNSVRIVNGKRSMSKSYHFIFRTKTEGSFDIPPAELRFNGNLIRSKAVKIMVKERGRGGASVGRSTPAYAHANEFLLSKVSKQTVYVGEQLIYELLFYRRVRRLWSNVSYELPAFKGFWSENLTFRESDNVVTLGQRSFYQRQLVKSALFPIQSGRMILDGAKAGYVLNPFDGQKVLTSEPIEITVEPLPEEGKPDGFSGVVGDFSLSHYVKEERVSVNSPITIQVVLSGVGNLRSISNLTFNNDQSFKIYQSKVDDHFDLNSEFSGKRVFEYIVVPKNIGDIQLPVFTLSYFSPKMKMYKNIQTPATIITVFPSNKLVDKLGGVETKLLEKLTTDLRYLKSPVRLKQYILAKDNLFVLMLFILDSFIFVAIVCFGIKYRFFKQKVFNFGRGHYYNKLNKYLKKLLAQDQILNEEFSRVENLLLSYLTSKFKVSVSGLTRQELSNILSKKKVTQNLINQTTNLLDKLDYMAYTPVDSFDKKLLIEEIQLLLSSYHKIKYK